MNRRQFGAALGATAASAAFSSRVHAAASQDFWRWSATDIAAAIKSKKVSCREITASALARLDSVNKDINAVIDVLADEALAAADAADAAVRANHLLGPLHGVPVTTKINADMRGRATTNGIAALKNNIAKDDSAPVHALRQAGAIIIGRTNTPAFSSRWFTDNDVHGRTLNPWNRSITPGGSSGGAAAAVAAGIGALAHGTDAAGSIRYPGYACGVVALKPSLGRASNYASSTANGSPIASQLVVVPGVLARNTQDAWLGIKSLSIRDSRDMWWTPAPFAYPPMEKPIKVALFANSPSYTARPSVSHALLQAAKAFTNAGYIVEEKQLPHFDEAADLWSLIVLNEKRESFLGAVGSLGDAKLQNAVKAWMDLTPGTDLPAFSNALARRAVIGSAWNALLEDFPIILMPNSWDAPFTLDKDQGGIDAMRDILKAQSPLLATALLGLPGMSVPTGLYDGMPTGVQIVAGRFREDLCIMAGAVIENEYPPITPVNPKI